MKTFIKYFLFLFFFILLINQLNFSQKTNNKIQKRYNIEKGTIEYKVTGDAINGTETVYFDKWGMREARYSKNEVKIGGMKQKTNTITFIEGNMIYTVDLNTNTGTKMENFYMKKLDDKNVNDFGKELLVEMGGKKTGSGEVIGKKCDIWEIENLNTKSWLWNWIPLKTEVNMVGVKTSTVATKFSESFDVKKLERPKNINYTERSDPMKMLEQMKKKN